MTAQEALELASKCRDDQSIYQAAQRILKAYYKGYSEANAEALAIVIKSK